MMMGKATSKIAHLEEIRSKKENANPKRRDSNALDRGGGVGDSKWQESASFSRGSNAERKAAKVRDLWGWEKIKGRWVCFLQRCPID